jgi:hypothetical protein
MSLAERLIPVPGREKAVLPATACYIGEGCSFSRMGKPTSERLEAVEPLLAHSTAEGIWLPLNTSAS